ncbi:18183_t:CDS:1, partial [Gigaspora margarita]
YKMIEYSDKFNKAKKILVCRSIKNIIIILHPKVHSLISTYGYSGAFNVKFLELESIIILDKNAYKIRDAINHPANEGVFLDDKDYDISLLSYVGK